MVDFNKKLKEYQDVKAAGAAIQDAENAASSVEEACLAGCGHSVYIHTEDGCQVEGCGCKCQVTTPTPVAETPVDDTPAVGASPDDAAAPSVEPESAAPASTEDVPVAPPVSSPVPPRKTKKAPPVAAKTKAPAPVATTPLPKPEAKLHKALTKRHVAPEQLTSAQDLDLINKSRKQNKAIKEALAKPVTKTAPPPKTKATPKPAVPVKGVSKAPVECGCGCGEFTKGGRFRPGHDAKYYAALKKKGIKTPGHK